MDPTTRSSESTADRLFSIQEAGRILGLSPATLRAWERRHGIPRPRRADNGYRLYSSADIETLRSLKARTDTGIRVGLAIEGLRSSPDSGEGAGTLDAAFDSLLEALLRMDERGAQAVLHQAFLLHPAEAVLADVFEPSLHWIGEQWHRGRRSIAVEHFASAFFVRQLVVLHAACPQPWRPGRVLAAGAPDDRHEIGLLMVAVGLRRRGWDVSYFGPSLPLAELERAARSLLPHVVLVSATLPLAAAVLDEILDLPSRLAPASPAIVLGGQAFSGAEAAAKGFTVLHAPFESILASLETILMRKTHDAAF
jgi:DNA-binding transcriptional MerR regulator/methylmalonyl-CoA mutase cobalamin-binding subunit